MRVVVASSVIERLHAEAAAAHPRECCGLLLGGETILLAAPAANVSADPERRFEIDPRVLVAAHKASREGGPAVLGYYHSHPGGSPVPSAEDRACASGDGRVWAIVACGQVAFWRDRPDGFEALPYTVAEG